MNKFSLSLYPLPKPMCKILQVRIQIILKTTALVKLTTIWSINLMKKYFKFRFET